MNRVFGSKKGIIPLLCIAPAFVLLFVFKLYPILLTVGESFVYKGALSMNNYLGIFEDPMFWKSIWVTIKFNLVTTPLQIVLAICLALLVNQRLKGIAIFRTIYYLPVTLSMTIATIVWGLMLNPNNGILNGILSILNVPAQPFLTSSKQALWSIATIATWKGVGFWMMFLLAGLQTINSELYEAARIDGAGLFRTIWSVTLPLLKGSLLFVIVADTTANLLLFAPMYMITKGGPASSTNVLMYEAYKSTILFGDRERGAALVTVLLLIIAAVVLLQFYFMRDKDEAAARRTKR